MLVTNKVEPMIQRALGILAVVFVATAPNTLIAAPRHTGIRGETWIYRGPPPPPGPYTQPVVRIFPVSASITILSARTGLQVARIQSDADGAFEIPLKPGTYIVVPETLTDPWSLSDPPLSYTPDPIEVTVKGHDFTYPIIVYLFPFPSVSAP